MVDRQQCDLSAQSVSLSVDKSSGKSADVSHCVHGMLYAAYIRIQTWQERNGFPSFTCSLCLGGDDSPRLPPFSSILTQKGNIHIVDRDGKLHMVRGRLQ